MRAMEVHPLDPTSDVPPFAQLRVQVASRAASGELPAGTRLPTVRALAAELGLAVNTVAKAYRALEADGVIATEGRRGTFIASPSASGASDVRAAARDAASSYAALTRRLGLTRQEALNLVDRAW